MLLVVAYSGLLIMQISKSLILSLTNSVSNSALCPATMTRRSTPAFLSASAALSISETPPTSNIHFGLITEYFSIRVPIPAAGINACILSLSCFHKAVSLPIDPTRSYPTCVNISVEAILFSETRLSNSFPSA
ncbi:MAG: hypothetical protein BWY74_03178 [Firmicutes bacterium ADurb.Bin419]|nr:MAG: hypothetical protein BWY74_03178 [Firmicutes bacterium ADurb.Bin419]